MVTRVSFHMEVLDSGNTPIGVLHPDHGATVTIQTGAARTLTGVLLYESEATDFDPDEHRLRPVMVEDGAEHSLGIFVPTVKAVHRTSLGDVLEVHGHDQSYLMTSTLQYAFNALRGDNVSDAIRDLAITAGMVVTEIADVPVELGTHLAWPPGTRILDAMAPLCRVGGLTTPWFDRDGYLRITPLPYVGAEAPRCEWQAGEASVLGWDAVEVDDRWNIANEWLVIGKSDDANVAGRYLLNASHPRSQLNGVRPLVRAIDVPGVATTAQCRDRARDEAQRDSKVHASVEVSVRTNPTVDQHDIIRYRDSDWLLAAASIPLTVGADMAVTLRESLVSGEGN